MPNTPTMPLLEAFHGLSNPRARECAHPVEELLLAAICAVISGAKSTLALGATPNLLMASLAGTRALADCQNCHRWKRGAPLMTQFNSDEKARLEALLRYHILDTENDPDFDDLTSLAAYICQTPIAMITLLDEKRQWFKSRLGLEVSETPREIAFCAYTRDSRHCL